MPDPQTYEEAIAQGFRPVADVNKLIGSHGITRERFSQRKLNFAAQVGVDCTTSAPGTMCLNWTDDNGVQTICYCTAAKSCDNCVQKP